MWINARISNGQRLVLASFQWRDVHAGANTGGDAGTTLPRAELQWLFEPSAFIESSGYATLPQTEIEKHLLMLCYYLQHRLKAAAALCSHPRARQRGGAFIELKLSKRRAFFPAKVLKSML